MEEKIRVMILEPDSNEPTISLIENKLETVQRIVGGFIQELRLENRGLYLIFNEEGLINHLPENKLATKMASIDIDVRIVGTAFITRIDINADNISLTDEDIKWINSILGGKIVV